MRKNRNEATIEEWRALYREATLLQEMEPWNQFSDMDLFVLKLPDSKEATYVSIMGNAGSCYGITCYKGRKGLNDFLMIVSQEELGLPTEFVMFQQNNLTCYWGNREELTKEQRAIIKELGYQYRGRNNWLYFQSYKKGYYPYNLDQREVRELTVIYHYLIQAIEYYRNHQLQVDFSKAQAYQYSYDKRKDSFQGKAISLPQITYEIEELELADDEISREIKKAKKCNAILEADLYYMTAAINDPEYERPMLPRLYLLADHQAGVLIHFDMVDPNENIDHLLADALLGFILQYGVPKRIILRNNVTAAVLNHICEICGIFIEMNPKLKAIDEFLEEFRKRF